MTPFSLLDTWPADTVAAAVIDPAGTVHRYGDTTAVFALASLTKLFTAAAVHLAVEEGSLELGQDVPALIDGESARGAVVADLLAHAGGFGPAGKILDDPGRRRIYSNGGYDLLASVVETSTEMPFTDYLREGLFVPLAMSSTTVPGSPAFAGKCSVDDLVSFLNGLPTLLAPSTLEAMTTPYLPELIGVLPGYGRQTPNLWGLGPEIRGTKEPHWTGERNSPLTWGHFGQAGTFLWVDPVHHLSVVVLTNLPFGDWAHPLWPAFSDAVIAELT